jgi:hypothetical protein
MNPTVIMNSKSDTSSLLHLISTPVTSLDSLSAVDYREMVKNSSILKEEQFKSFEPRPINIPFYRPDSYAYAVVEQEMWPSLKSELLQLSQNIRFHSLFQDVPTLKHLQTGPLLIELTNNDTVFNEIIAKMTQKPSGIILYYSNKPSWGDLCQILATRLTATSDKSTFVLRFYEPRQELNLFNAMTIEERATFYPGAHKIEWYDQQWLRCVISCECKIEQNWTINSMNFHENQ